MKNNMSFFEWVADNFPIVLIGLLLLSVVALVFVSIFISFGLSSGGGEQVGYISEVERNGIFWRPVEIRLISIEPTYSQTDTAWYYGSISDDITEKAVMHMKNHDKVIVKYETRLLVTNWEFSNRVIMTDIELVKEDTV